VQGVFNSQAVEFGAFEVLRIIVGDRWRRKSAKRRSRISPHFSGLCRSFVPDVQRAEHVGVNVITFSR